MFFVLCRFKKENGLSLSRMSIFLIALSLLVGFCFLSCVAVYLVQEKLIFKPKKLDRSHRFGFENNFEEMYIRAKDGKLLNGLLFRNRNSKGLVFYLHGNIGSLNSWGQVPKNYIDLGYDVFIFDYRSYGKSEGKIKSQQQLYDDNQTIYTELKKQYTENKIILLGHSLGSGMAAKLAADNQAEKLILITPYYSFTDLVKNLYPLLPTFILKYRFPTYKYLKKCNIPIVIFHGDRDELIDCEASYRLQKEFKPNDKLIILKNQNHRRINDNEQYKNELAKIL